MTSRRTLLIGMTAGATGVAGAVFGSGAFTTVEADRDFVIDLAADGASQLLVTPDGDLRSKVTDTHSHDLHARPRAASVAATRRPRSRLPRCIDASSVTDHTTLTHNT